MARRVSNKKKLDRIVIGTCIYFVSFMIVAWVTYWVKGDVPDTLIQFGSGGGALELALAAGIEICTNKKGERNGEANES